MTGPGPSPYDQYIAQETAQALGDDLRSTTTEVSERIARATAQRLEREILGAWQAGYDYLHVCHRYNLHPRGPKTRYKPSNNDQPPSVYQKNTWSIETYDLRWLFPQDVAALK